jgi:hypothetical protein
VGANQSFGRNQLSGQSRKNQAAAQYFVNEPVIERIMQDANALGAFLTPALQGAPKIWLPPRDSKRFLAIFFP